MNKSRAPLMPFSGTPIVYGNSIYRELELDMMKGLGSMEEKGLPPGFRFHPTDQELITYYLCNKVSNFSFTTNAVVDVDLNKCEPWDLPAKASMGEKEWYFFSQRDRKYPTGLRTNRATEAGYWKTTGKDKEIFHGGASSHQVLVGMKKTLVFYRGRAPKGEKTNWVMHEYRLHNNQLAFKPTREEWVVCRVFQKSTPPKRPQQVSSSPPSPESPSETNAMVNELSDIDFPNFATTIPLSSPHDLISLQTYRRNTSDDIPNNIINWNPVETSATNNSIPPASLTWPLLTTNLSMNSLLLTALQLRGHHQPRGSPNPATDINNYNLLLNANNSHGQFGNDHFGSSTFNMGSTSSVPHMQQQQETYNMDPNIW